MSNVCAEDNICETNYYCNQSDNTVACSPICYHANVNDPVCCTKMNGDEVVKDCSSKNEMCYIRDPAQFVGDYVCTYVFLLLKSRTLLQCE